MAKIVAGSGFKTVNTKKVWIVRRFEDEVFQEVVAVYDNVESAEEKFNFMVDDFGTESIEFDIDEHTVLSNNDDEYR